MSPRPAPSDENAATPTPPWRARPAGPALLLGGLLLALAANLPATGGEFFSDDYVYVQGNRALRAVPLSEPWRFFAARTNPYEYLPVRDLSHRLDLALFGDDPLGHHLHNLLLYGLCCLAVWLLLGALLRPGETTHRSDPTSEGADRVRPDPLAGWRGARLLGTLFFAVHPAHVESVAWISGRKELLSGLFAALALWLYVEAVRRPRVSIGAIAGACLGFGVALLSKASVLPLPLVALGMGAAARGRPAGRAWPRLLATAAPLFALAAAATWLHLQTAVETHLVQGGAPEGMIGRGGAALAILGTLGHIALLPARLRLVYDVQAAGPLGWATMAAGGAIAVGGAWGALAVWRRGSLHGLAALTFAVFCLPFLQILPFGTWSLASERFLFLPLLGPALAFGRIGAAGTMGGRRRTAGPRWRPVAAGAALLVLTALTAARSAEWRRRQDLLCTGAERAQTSFVAWQRCLAWVLLPARRFGEARAGADRVRDRGGRALLRSWVEVSEALASGDPGRARTQAAMLDRLARGRRLPVVELALARWHEGQGQPFEAAARYHAVATTAFTGAIAERARRSLAGLRARFEPRMERLRRATREHPGDPGPLGTLGNLQMELRMLDEAERSFTRVLALAPNHPAALYNLGLTRARMGRHAEAARDIRRAIESGMDRAAAWNNLGIALERTGDVAGAEGAFSRALARDPRGWHAAWNLARLRAARGDRNGAREALAEALRGARDDPAGRALLELQAAELR